MRRWKNYILLFSVSVVISSCAIHSYFPFICFQRGCVQEQFNLKGLKKRVNAKRVVMVRKRNKRRSTTSKTEYRSISSSRKENRGDTVAIIKGTNVDYYRYLLFFRVQRCINCFDTLLVEHTSEYHTLIETDQSRLTNMIDTIKLRNIVTVYIKPLHHKDMDDVHYPHQEKHRKKDIRKFLERNGIKSQRIKMLQDSLSPPKL